MLRFLPEKTAVALSSLVPSLQGNLIQGSLTDGSHYIVRPQFSPLSSISNPSGFPSTSGTVTAAAAPPPEKVQYPFFFVAGNSFPATTHPEASCLLQAVGDGAYQADGIGV